LELRTDELIREGRDPVSARREAERRFGNRRTIERRMRKEARRRGEARDGRWTMGWSIRDVTFALRGLARNPGFAVVAVLTLAVALASNTTIFSVLDAAVLRALPFPEAERLVFVNGYQLQDGERAIRNASIPEFRDWQARARSISPMVGYDVSSVTLSRAGEGAERVVLETVSEGYFDVLGAGTALGRGFTDEELATPDAFPVVMLSHELWGRRFAGDPGVVGSTLEVNERSVTVVGVLAEGFRGVSLEAEMWAPLSMIGLVGSPDLLESRGSRFLPVLGRLVPGATVEQAEAELDVVARELQALHPDTHEDRFARVQSFREGYLGTTGELLWILFGAGALLLVVASANVANLLLVRAYARTSELVLRRALGASGGRISAQLMTESLVIAGLGGVVGLALSAWGLRGLGALVPEGVLPTYAAPELSARVFVFTLGVLLLVGLAAGVLPALRSGRGDLADGLRGTRGAAAGGRAQRAFVVTQVALALLILVGAGLLGRSFRAQLAVDPGLEMAGVHVFRIQLPTARYPTGASLRDFSDELLRRVGAVPGVTSVAASSDFPFRGRSSGSFVARADDPENLIRYHRHSVSPGYFENLGVELLAGRLLESGDDEQARGVAVVTEAFVRRVFPGDASGVGRTFWIGNPSNPDNLAEIVGVIGNVRYRDLTQDMMAEANSPDVFFSLRQVPARTLEVSYLTAIADGATRAVREAVQELDPDVPVFAEATLVDAYRQLTATPRFAALLMSIFGVLALSLASVGIYGVLAFTVSRQGREIAVRRALGARARDVASSVVGNGLRMAAIGAALGGAGAVLAVRLLEGLLFQVAPTDFVTFLAAAGLTLGVSAVATAVPAVRAARRPPADALSQD
jgi:predicted permease